MTTNVLIGGPTTDEACLPGFYASIWFGIWAPKGTPKDIIDKLNTSVVATLADANVNEKLNALGRQIASRDLQDSKAFAAFEKAEADKWYPITKATNIKLQ